MEVRELKFLLKLAALPEHKGKIGQIKPTPRTKIADTEKICRSLRDRALVDFQEQVTQLQISAVGKALLELSLDNLPVTLKELKILQACRQDIITPQQIKVTPAKKRNELINSLSTRGLVTAIATKIQQVWLTEKGKNYLLTEYQPQGYSPVLSLDLLNNYLSLFRHNNLFKGTRNREQHYPVAPHPFPVLSEAKASVKEKIYNQETNFRLDNSEIKFLSDEKVLQTILDLDRQLNTHNYLPIFYLREKLQSLLSREELDLALYRLQRQDKLELSSIVNSARYTREQLQAGIPQNVGGCLFFLIVS